MQCCRTCCAIYRNGFDRCPIDGSALSPFDSDPVVGTTINGLYEVEACVGEGAMGRVYRAHHLRLRQRQVALKILLGDLAASVTMRLRFSQEAQAASVLSHPNVVPVLDFGKTPRGLLYLAMEFVEGRSLARVIAKEGPLDAGRVIRLVRQLCLGLGHAHSHGLVHRDFKPDNVIVVSDTDGEIPRIADFGLAIFAGPDEETARLTCAGTVVGTPMYTAPEQAMDRDIDHRTDLFALGVSMFEMLAGRPPFADASPVEVLHHNLAAQRPRIGQRAPGVIVPPGLEQIVLRLMSADRNERYPTAHAVVEALDALGWRAIGSGHTHVQLATGSVSSAPAAQPRRPARRLATVAVGGLVLALFGVLWPRGHDRVDGEGAVVPGAVESAVEMLEKQETGDRQPATGNRQPGEMIAAAEGDERGVTAGGDEARESGGAAQGSEPRGEAGRDLAASDSEARAAIDRGRAPRAIDGEAGPRADQAASATPRPPFNRGEADRAAAQAARTADIARRDRAAQGAMAAVTQVPNGPRGESIEAADVVPASQVPAGAVSPTAAPVRPGSAGARPTQGARGAAITQPAGRERAAPARPTTRALALPRRSIDAIGFRPVIGGLSVDGSLADAEVRRALDRIAPRLDACARAANLAAAPVVRAEFLIDENGRARAVRTTGASSVAGCVAGALGAVRTRVAPDVGEVRVSLRVTFSAGSAR
jgi:eukaryotic-like serine/threonine-protein kinase